MSKAFACSAVILLIFASSGAPAFALSLKELVYVTEEFEPYNYLEDDVPTGLAVELLELVWQQLGVPPQKINFYPWARGYMMLQHQPGVVLFTTARTLEREKKFKWAGPIIDRGQRCVFIALKNRAIHLEKIDAAGAYRIGTIREDYAEQVILAMGVPRSSIEPSRNLVSNINKLQAKRIDLIAYTEKAFYDIVATAGYNRQDFKSVYLITEVFPCYAFNNTIPDKVVRQFQEALSLVKLSPEYPDLLKRYNFK